MEDRVDDVPSKSLQRLMKFKVVDDLVEMVLCVKQPATRKSAICKTCTRLGAYLLICNSKPTNRCGSYAKTSETNGDSWSPMTPCSGQGSTVMASSPFSAFPVIPLVFFPVGFTHYVMYHKLTQDSRKYFSHYEKASKYCAPLQDNARKHTTKQRNKYFNFFLF